MKKTLLSLLLIPLAFVFTVGTSFAVPAAPAMSYEINGYNIAISWTEVPGATSYRLYYAPYPYAGLDTIESASMGGATSFAVDLFENAAYYIAVTASDATGESPYSNVEYFVMTPSAPDAPVLSSGLDGLEISLSWTEVPDATGYRLYFSADTAPESFASIDVGDETNVSYYLWEGAAYYLKLTAYNDSGLESEFSNMEYFIMGPPTPEWVDDDGDGFTEYDGDCDDSEQGTNPDAEEICGDGIDQDCNGEDEICEIMTVEPPTLQLAPGVYDEPQTLTLATDTPGASIYYTTDGTTPTAESSLYSTPLTVSTTQIVKAIAIKDGMENSDVSVGSYTITNQAFAPTFSPAPGVYYYPQNVSISSETDGASIHYTTNGASPSAGSTLYSTPVEVSSTRTVKAIAVKTGIADSEVVSGIYTIRTVAGVWALRMVTGPNTCAQTVGEETLMGDVTVTQSGQNITVATPFGTETGTIIGNSLSWSMSLPLEEGEISGTLTFSMQLYLSPDGNSFSGPVNFTFSGDPLSCSGSATVYGDRQ